MDKSYNNDIFTTDERLVLDKCDALGVNIRKLRSTVELITGLVIIGFIGVVLVSLVASVRVDHMNSRIDTLAHKAYAAPVAWHPTPQERRVEEASKSHIGQAGD